MTRARIIYTFKCNRSCGYCCNTIPVVRDSFKPITRTELQATRDDEYAITGGEPLLDPDGVFDLARQIYNRSARIGRHAKVHLYTNGDLLEQCHGRDWWAFDGVNIGVHEVPEYKLLAEAAWLNSGCTVRLMIPETLKFHPFVLIAERLGLKTRFWKMNECLDMPAEPRFYLS